MATQRKRIEAYHVGDRESLTHQVTDEDVQLFARLTGDDNPLHLDPAFARGTSMKRPVVYGMLSASFLSTLIGTKLPGPGALWTSQTIEFAHPVFVGDTLTVSAVVQQVSHATDTLVLAVTAVQQDGDVVLHGTSTVELLPIEEGEAPADEPAKRVCLILGGSSEIGRAVARRLLADGYRVALHCYHAGDRVQAFRAATEHPEDVLPVQADLADAGQAAQMVRGVSARLGSITAVVHCAAPRNALHPFADLTWEDIQRQIDVQVRGFFTVMHAVLPRMVEERIAGRVVCISSIAADDVPPAQQHDYVLAKAALTALTKSLAVEYGPKGIALNLVAPGMTETERIASMPQKAKLLTKMQSPGRHLIRPQEVADAVAFLLGRETCAMTGETLRVCSGIHML